MVKQKKQPAGNKKLNTSPENLSIIQYANSRPYTSYFGRPTGRKEEQDWLEKRKALFLNPEFRKDLMFFKRKFPKQYWDQKTSHEKDLFRFNGEVGVAINDVWERHKKKRRLSYIGSPTFIHPNLRSSDHAKALCAKWDLPEEHRFWIEWLCKNWDPAEQISPPPEPPHLEPSFNLWRIGVEYAQSQELYEAFERSDNLTDRPPLPQKVILTLWPGVSVESAKQAVEKAMEFLPRNKNGRRPGLTDREKKDLDEVFDNIYLSGVTKRKEIINQTYLEVKKWRWEISIPTLKKYLILWLKRKGHPITEYKKFPL